MQTRLLTSLHCGPIVLDMEHGVHIIRAVHRLPNSANGNPRFRIDFEGQHSALTQSDAGFAYAVGNSNMREGSAVYVEYTRAGRIRHMGPTS